MSRTFLYIYFILTSLIMLNIAYGVDQYKDRLRQAETDVAAVIPKHPPAYHPTIPMERKFGPIVRILGPDGQFTCSGTVLSPELVLTAAHCISDDMKGYAVQNEAQTTSQPVVVHGFLRSQDLAILGGNFIQYSSRVAVTNFNGMTRQTTFVTCGYPLGQKDINCYKFEPKNNYTFFMQGKGYLVPGMSGGPVFDEATKEIVGLNTGATNDSIILAPLIGLELLLKVTR